MALDDDHIRAGEAGEAVKGIDAVFGKLPFPIAGDHIGAAALKHHQVVPINPRLADDAMPVHTALRVNRLGAADQHPFRIAATQGTRTAELAMVNHCDRAPRLAHASCRHLRGGAAAYDKNIIIIMIPAPPRTESSRRLYSGTDVRVLAFIRRSRELARFRSRLREFITPPGPAFP